MAYTNTFGYGVDGDNYTPATYEELGDAIGKVAKQIIRDVGAVNPMERFDKGIIENGDTVEQAVVKMVTASGYDSTGAGAMTRSTAEKLSVRYFKNWQRHTYKTTIDIPMLKKILLAGGSGAEEVATKLVGALGVSAENDRFQAYKDLFVWGTTTASWSDNINSIFVGQTPVYNLTDGTIDYKGVLKKIKNLVKDMQFVNTSYNRVGLKRRTLPEDIVIVMPYTLVNALDVDELAGVFNLDKAEIKNKIVEIDDTTHNYVYILDKNVVQKYVRLYEMATQKNADGLFMNYFLHVEDMYALSPLFDSAFFQYGINAPAEA